MADTEDFDTRLANEVSALLTKLMTAVAKSLELEETVLHLHRENALLRSVADRAADLDRKYHDVFQKYLKIYREWEQLKKDKAATELENRKLQSEVEELSESLFDEANKMVSNASRETFNFKVKNKKLYEEIEEKNSIIENLQDQLKDLKGLFIKMEDQHKLTSSRAGTPKLDSLQFANDEIDGEEDVHQQQLQRLIYLPNVKAIRYDLAHYQQDFKGFIYHIIRPDFQFDLTNLKMLRFFRKIWTEELENSIASVPPVPTANFINRWLKGKNFWNLLVEGKALIQPVSGVNETFKINYKGTHRHSDAPVAIRDPCSFCGEAKDDVLEHARLYTLNLVSESSTGEHILAEYPLCNFCLIKLRNICDLFAKLRLIHANVYRLKPRNDFDEYALHSLFQFKRNISASGSSLTHQESAPVAKQPVESSQEAILMKLYLMLLLIRNKIFWSKIGFWDNREDIEELNVDEMQYESFGVILNEEVTLNEKPLPQVKTPVAQMPGSFETPELASEVTGPAQEIPEPAPETTRPTTEAKLVPTTENPDEDSDDDFRDTSDYFRDTDPSGQFDVTTKRDVSSGTVISPSNTSSQVNNQVISQVSDPAVHVADSVGLSRKNSTSKQFSQRLSTDLDRTLDMLKESMDLPPSPA